MYDDDCHEGRSIIDLNIESRFGGSDDDWHEDTRPGAKLSLPDYQARYNAELRKEAPSAYDRLPLVLPHDLLEEIRELLATSPQPLTPTSLYVQDPGGFQWTALVRPIMRNRIEVTFDRRNP